MNDFTADKIQFCSSKGMHGSFINATDVPKRSVFMCQEDWDFSLAFVSEYD